MPPEPSGPSSEASQPSPRRHLYMFAIMPSLALGAEIQELQEYVAKQYRSREALRRPVHITLIPPFSATAEDEPKLVGFVKGFSRTTSSFEVAIHGFGQFRERVIFVQPAPSAALQLLHDQFSKAFAAAFEHIETRNSHDDFHPHFTIGYRDLSHPMFERAWAEFRDRRFDRSLGVDHISLLRHDNRWIEIARGEFAK